MVTTVYKKCLRKTGHIYGIKKMFFSSPDIARQLQKKHTATAATPPPPHPGICAEGGSASGGWCCDDGRPRIYMFVRSL